MKIQLLVVALVWALGTSPAPAQAQEQQQSHPMEQTAPPGAITAEPILPLTLMQWLDEMQAYWQKMIQTTDPMERQQLMQEHQEKMQALGAILRLAQANDSGATGGGIGGQGGARSCGMIRQGGGMACGVMGCGGMGQGGSMSSMLAHHKAMMAVLQQLEKRVEPSQTTVEPLLADEEC